MQPVSRPDRYPKLLAGAPSGHYASSTMSRVVLIHWNTAEGNERAATLRKAGHTAKVVTPKAAADFRSIATNPPHVLVIDLTRLPAQGREAAFWFRQRKATRAVPIVFAGGDPEKVSGIKTHLPDAQFTEWMRVRGAVPTWSCCSLPRAPSWHGGSRRHNAPWMTAAACGSRGPSSHPESHQTSPSRSCDRRGSGRGSSITRSARLTTPGRASASHAAP